jgi:hypothetical protein
MRLWKLNSCPKCRGTLFVGSDSYGQYLTAIVAGAGIWTKPNPCPKSPISRRTGRASRMGAMYHLPVSNAPCQIVPTRLPQPGLLM